MKQLFAIDLRDYNGCSKTFRRPSARAIIIQDGKIALVYSRTEKYYKFPGGGIHGDEDRKNALVREAREETGLIVIPDSITPFGSVMRRQKSNMSPDTVFEQENFYYICRAENEIAEQHLDDYEREAGFVLQFTGIDDAIRVNDEFTCGDSFDMIMIKRELRVLRMIRETMTAQTLLPYAYMMSTFPDVKSIYAGEYAEALDGLLAGHPGSRFLNELEGIVGARESASYLLENCGSAVVAPDDFGRVFLRLLRTVYQKTELSAFAKATYRLWEKLPEGIRNTEPFLQLCFADDPLSALGDEARTRRMYENLLTYYDRKDN